MKCRRFSGFWPNWRAESGV